MCILNEVDAYLNRADVQEALHARLVGVSSWSLCSGWVSISSQYHHLFIPKSFLLFASFVAVF